MFPTKLPMRVNSIPIQGYNRHLAIQNIVVVASKPHEQPRYIQMNFKFSGHESFPCRYTWLPKVYRLLKEDGRAFSNEETAMVELGVGKNMVRSIKFWAQVTDIAKPCAEGGYLVTEFADAIFGEDGHDPFLEDIRTLWLLHWKMTTQAAEPLFAWDYLLNRWQHPEITRFEVIAAFKREAARMERQLSQVTLEQHFDTFLHTYVPTRSRKGEILEDNLDSPLVELELIQRVGERKMDKGGRHEVIYAFRRESKPEISPQLFLYCLNDFWKERRSEELTLSFRDVSVGHGSPGQVFKLPERDLKERLDSIKIDSSGTFDYQESAAIQQVLRLRDCAGELLDDVYATEHTYV